MSRQDGGHVQEKRGRIVNIGQSLFWSAHEKVWATRL